MKDKTLIRKILELVSYSYKDEYWGHDTAMDAKEIERKAQEYLDKYKDSQSHGGTQ